MDILFACLKLGIVGFFLGHILLLYFIYWLGKRRPGAVRAIGRRLALLLIGPETTPAESEPAQPNRSPIAS